MYVNFEYLDDIQFSDVLFKSRNIFIFFILKHHRA